MTQAQRDAAHIAALEKQVADLSDVVKALACNKSHLEVRITSDEIAQTANLRMMLGEYAKQAAMDAGHFILKQLGDRADLYWKLSKYEQWFYAKATTRHDALRSTMTTAR
jgi:hypothetical protein